MSQRILHGIAFGAVGLVVVGAIVVIAIDRLKPPPVAPVPGERTFALRVELPEGEPPESNAQPPSRAAGGRHAEEWPDAAASGQTQQPPPPPPPRKWAWAEVEEELDKLRASRATSPTAWDELSQWYGRLSDIAFTQSKDYPEHIKKLEAWRAEFPESPTPLVALGRTYIRYAWDARGSGLAFTVSEVGWELYHQRIEEAHRLLEDSLTLGVRDGEVYARLVEVAKAKSLPLEEAARYVEEGRKADATYFPIYQSQAENLLPRWGGQPGDVERFAAELVEKIPGDDGLVAFGLVAWRIHSYENLLFWGKYDRELLGKAAVALAERFPNSTQVVNFAALCTVAAQDHAAARRIRPLVGPFNAEDRIWLWPNSHLHFIQWAEATELPTGEAAWVFAPQLGATGIAFAPNERYVWAAGQYEGVQLVDTQTQSLRSKLLGPDRILNHFAFETRQNVAAACFWPGPSNQPDSFQGWIIWDAGEEEVIASRPCSEQVRALAIHPSAPRIAWAESKTIRFLDLTTDEVTAELTLPDFVHELVFSPDGSLLYAKTGIHTICDATTGKALFDLGFDGKIRWPHLTVRDMLALDEHGRAWATAFEMSQQPHRIALVRFSPDGKSFDNLVPDLGEHTATVLSPDHSYLAAVPGRNPNTWQPSPIDLWDIDSGKKVKQLSGHWNRIKEVAFSHDGKKLASVAHMPDVIKIWSLEDLPGE